MPLLEQIINYKDTSFDTIYRLAKEKNEVALRNFLETEACIDVRQIGPIIYTPASLLAIEGDHDSVAFLMLKFNANPNFIVCSYAQKGDEKKVKYLIQHGGSVNAALIGAGFANNQYLINYLYNHGGNLNFALYGASLNNNEKLTQELLSKGADLEYAVKGMISCGNVVFLQKHFAKLETIHYRNTLLAMSPHYDKLTAFIVYTDRENLCQGFSRVNRFDLAYDLIKKNRLSGINMLVGVIALGYKKLIKSLDLHEYSHNIYLLAEMAGQYGHLDLIEHLIFLAHDVYTKNFMLSQALEGAQRSENLNLVKIFIKKYPDFFDKVANSTYPLNFYLANYYSQKITANTSPWVLSQFTNKIIKNTSLLHDPLRTVSFINNPFLRANLIKEMSNLKLIRNNKNLFTQQTTKINELMTQCNLDYQEARAWMLNQQIHVWFLQGIQLISNPFPFEIFIEISAYLLGFSTEETHNFYKKHQAILPAKLQKQALENLNHSYHKSLPFMLFSWQPKEQLEQNYEQQKNAIITKYYQRIG